MSHLSSIAREGLWTGNPALVKSLGLCPLLAVSGDLATSLGLGLATLLVLVFSNFLISLIRKHIDQNTRLPIQIMIIATAVTCVDILMQAYLFDLHQRVGLFIALIVTNCILLGRSETFASKQPVLLAVFDGLMTGLGFLLVITLMGAMREILGQGTLLANLQLLTGVREHAFAIEVLNEGFLLMVLPPGAFLTLGFIIAGKNVIDQKLTRKPEQTVRARISLTNLD